MCVCICYKNYTCISKKFKNSMSTLDTEFNLIILNHTGNFVENPDLIRANNSDCLSFTSFNIS